MSATFSREEAIVQVLKTGADLAAEFGGSTDWERQEDEHAALRALGVSFAEITAAIERHNRDDGSCSCQDCGTQQRLRELGLRPDGTRPT